MQDADALRSGIRRANQAFREGRFADALQDYRLLAALEPEQRELVRAALHRCLCKLGSDSLQSLRVEAPDASLSLEATRYQGRELQALLIQVPPQREPLHALKLHGLRLAGPGLLQMRVLGSSDWIQLAEVPAQVAAFDWTLGAHAELICLRLIDAALAPDQVPALQAIDFHWRAAAPLSRPSEPSGVAAGVASQPERALALRQVIGTLLHQVDELHVFLNGYPEVPDWLRRLPQARVYRSQDWDDLGDAGKFHGYTRSQLPYYLSFDDDILYPSDYVSRLKEACQRYGAPVGVHGRLLRQPNQGYYGRADSSVLHYRRALAHDRRVHILGTGTLMIPRAAVPRLPDFDFRNMADIWFARHCMQAQIPLHALARRAAWLRDAPGVYGSIFDQHRGSHSDQRLIVDALVREQAQRQTGQRGPRPKFMLGLRSFRRMASLSSCLQQLLQTACDDRFELVVVIADDGSSAQALQWVYELQFPFELHVIRNPRRVRAAAQTNSLIERAQQLRADFVVIADDTLRLLRKGWMSAYFDAAMATGQHHLCHAGGVAPTPRRHADGLLQDRGGLRQRPGLMTLTPAVMAAVGRVDESLGSDSPESLIDFSRRCCEAGFNEAERLYEPADADSWLSAAGVAVGGLDPGGSACAEAAAPVTAAPEAVAAWAGFDRILLVHASREQPRGPANQALRARRQAYWTLLDLGIDTPGLADEHQAYLRRWRAAELPADSPDSELARCARLEAQSAGPALASLEQWLALRNWQRRLREAWTCGAQRLLIVHEDARWDESWAAQLELAMAELPRHWRLLQWAAPSAAGRPYSAHWRLCDEVLPSAGLLALQREVIPVLLDSLDRELLGFEQGALPRALRRFAEQSFAAPGPGDAAWPDQDPLAAVAPQPLPTLQALPRDGRRPRVVVGIKTFNRRPYLQDCIESLVATACGERFELVLLVADDGSVDGTLDYLAGLQLPFAIEVLRHQRVYVAAQFNAIAERALALQADFGFSVDDDVHFKRKGWMSAYYDAAMVSGFHHLCHFNRPHALELAARQGSELQAPRRHRDFPLEAHAGVDRAMGALFSFSPGMLQAVGFADEVNFFVRGGWHADYSARCCRAGFNEISRFWDLADSNSYLELQNNKGGAFHSAIDWDDEAFRRASTHAERERRAALRTNPDRLFIGRGDARQGPLWTLEQAQQHRQRRIEDLFERVFVINLDRRADRLAAIAERLGRLGIAFERIAAVDGQAAEVQQAYASYRASRPRPDARHLLSAAEFFSDRPGDAARTLHVEARVQGPAIRSAGAWAYSLTYQRLLQRCQAEQLERVLVLDDDCLFHRDFDALLDRCAQELPRDWKLFQLGSMQYDWALTRPYSEHLYMPDGVLVASHAVGLHRDCFAPLLEGIARWSLPFDIGPLQDCSRRFAEASFIAQPNLIIQDQAESDINSSDQAAEEVAKAANVYRWVLADYC